MPQVYQYNRYGRLVAVWSNLIEAAEMTDVPFQSIHECCKQRVLQTGGYTWSYLPK